MKLAVVFPGIGYHADKPLLYYSKKLALFSGYEVREVNYGNFSSDVKGNAGKMEEAFVNALSQAEELLGDIDYSAYTQLLFISKSIGTAVAGAYAKKHGLQPANIYYTPVEQTFQAVKNRSGIVFHGTADPWAETGIIKAACARLELLLYITEEANHSLETGDVLTDLAHLQKIMEITKDYIGKL